MKTAIPCSLFDYRNSECVSLFLSIEVGWSFHSDMFNHNLFLDMASSKRWATTISRTASCSYFLLIFFQIPLFRVPCRGEPCTTPLELTCSQLLASEVFPAPVVQALLYPGAIAKGILENKPIPTFNSLPNIYKFIHVNAAASPLISDLYRLEVIAGCYLAVAGAIVGMVRPGRGRMSLFGCLVTVWGIVRRSSYSNPKMEISSIYPTMFVAVALAFLSVRKDVRRIVRGIRAQGKCSWKKAKRK